MTDRPAPGPVPPSFREAAAQHFELAEQRGFPVFLTPSRDSNPVNGTPYAAPYATFRTLAARWPGRAHLVEALDAVRAEAESAGLAVEFILIGGSFTEIAKPAPNDIDCLLLYRRRDPTVRTDVQAIAAIERRGRANGADARLLALDADPLLLLKTVAYFSILYSNDKWNDAELGVRVVRALFLIDCRDAAPR